jgi:hypothetical protein
VYEAHLLRRSYREGGKVRNETVANLSRLPRETIELVRRSLRGEQFLSSVDGFEICRSLPHGQVAAVLGMARRLELARLLDRRPSPERSRVLAMICQQVLAAGSKLACTRALGQSTLAEELQVEGVDADELYGALDWLGERQERIEARLARRHLEEGSHVLYDVSSPTSRAAAVRCSRLATRVTAAPARSSSSTGCSQTGRGGRSRSSSSRAASTTTRRCPPRSRSCAPASASARWF